MTQRRSCANDSGNVLNSPPPPLSRIASSARFFGERPASRFNKSPILCSQLYSRPISYMERESAHRRDTENARWPVMCFARGGGAEKMNDCSAPLRALRASVMNLLASTHSIEIRSEMESRLLSL